MATIAEVMTMVEGLTTRAEFLENDVIGTTRDIKQVITTMDAKETEFQSMVEKKFVDTELAMTEVIEGAKKEFNDINANLGGQTNTIENIINGAKEEFEKIRH